MKSVSWLALIVLAWAALSGHHSLEPLVFAFGVVSCLVVWLLVVRMNVFAQGTPLPRGLPLFVLRLLRYLGFLAIQVIAANLHVARLILDPRLLLRQKILRVKAGQSTAFGQMIHANSITLTPGTVTLDVRDDELLVHSLDAASASAVVRGEIDRAVSRVEGPP